MKSFLTAIISLSVVLVFAQDKSTQKELSAYGRDGKTIIAKVLLNNSAKSKLFLIKTIQTKEERANLVYAIKVKVKNDGFLKIGMYGEVQLAEEKK